MPVDLVPFPVNSTFFVCQVVVLVLSSCGYRVSLSSSNLAVTSGDCLARGAQEHVDFLGLTSSLCFRIQRKAWFEVWIHAHASVFGCICKFFPFFFFFHTWRWTSDPEVGSRPSLLVWRSVHSRCFRWRMWGLTEAVSPVKHQCQFGSCLAFSLPSVDSQLVPAPGGHAWISLEVRVDY